MTKEDIYQELRTIVEKTIRYELNLISLEYYRQLDEDSKTEFKKALEIILYKQYSLVLRLLVEYSIDCSKGFVDFIKNKFKLKNGA